MKATLIIAALFMASPSWYPELCFGSAYWSGETVDCFDHPTQGHIYPDACGLVDGYQGPSWDKDGVAIWSKL